MDTKGIIEENLLDILIQKIVDEVVRRIKNQPKTALVLFTGATIGFRQAMDSLLKLQGDGWQLKVVLSDDGMKVLDSEAIKKELNLDTVYFSGNVISQKELYGTVDMMIIGSMSVNTAAKLAIGITDTVLLSLINHGFMAGTPVIGAIDACDPDDPKRAALGMGNSPKMYREMLLKNIETLRCFGMQLVQADCLYEAAVGKKLKEAEPKNLITNNIGLNPREHSPKADVGKAYTISKKVITRSDILKAQKEKVVIIPSEAIITEYAIEAIKTFELEIIRN
ncbi:MAG: flavoprotein [Eubacteriaceae bacterium]